ncbi:hypothetical protein PVAND_007549 [Polypedilum vanderplanki]|uniref:Solute carrier family 66 member 3 n=1 Tax=Polypedilum vanderplanki TaxID=319348 RepID=A0A9J6C6W6_POLVA|nr:hypothetical protein PVAND_007549 [Polypedilum vanderplanki]
MGGILYIISDILSFITIASCLIAKVPQIITIFKAKSAAGLSMKSLGIETASYTVSTLYNFTNGYKILNYFEYIILLVQNYMLIGIVLFYRKQLNQKFIGFATLYWIIAALFTFSILPKSILTLMIPGTLPASVISKTLQLLEIIRTKDSSSISAITWFISAFTNATRIYTILLDSADIMLLANFIISTALSSAVLTAVIYYKKPKVKDE